MILILMVFLKLLMCGYNLNLSKIVGNNFTLLLNLNDILTVVVEQQVIPRNRSTSDSVSVTIGLKGILKKSIPTHINAGRFLRFYFFPA